jgi:hypothetical protein
MGKYKIGDRVRWTALNYEPTGTVVGFHGDCAVVRVDRTGGTVLLQNEPIKDKRK